MKFPHAVLFFLLWGVSLGIASAQKISERDSLLTVFKQHPAQDTSFVKLLNNLSRVYRVAVPDSSILFSKMAYEAATRLGYKRGIATSLNTQGVAYFFKGDYPTAQTFQQQALEYSRSHHLTALTATALNSLALAYHYQGNYQSALPAYLEALHAEEVSKNLPGRMKVLSNISLLWKRQGNLDNAIQYILMSLTLTDSIKDPRSAKANLYNNLGLIYTEQKKFEEALKYLHLSLNLNQELGNKVFVVNGLNNIGYCYLNMNRLDEARPYFERSMHDARELNATSELALAMLNLSEVYALQGDAQRALPLSKESLAMSQKANNKQNILENYKGLALVYRKLGKPELSADFLERAMSLSDSMKNADITKRISDMQNSYELNKKESEINLLETEASLKKIELRNEKYIRYGLIGLIAGLCLMAGSIYYNFSVKASLNKKLQKQNEEIVMQNEMIEKINAELKARALRAQMNPHFIFNSLNSIQFLIFRNNNEKAYHYLSRFAKLLRTVMDNSQESLITLANEIDTLQLYLDLESLRFNAGFKYDIRVVPETLDTTAVRVMPLVVQPFIENAILHGLLPKEDDRVLKVTFEVQQGNLVCEITDNGIGRKAASEISMQKNKMYESRGMSFTDERIQVFNKLNGKNSEIEIIDLTDGGQKPVGTKVIIRF